MDDDEMREMLRSLSGDQLAEWFNLTAEEMQRRRRSARLRALCPQLELVK